MSKKIRQDTSVIIFVKILKVFVPNTKPSLLAQARVHLEYVWKARRIREVFLQFWLAMHAWTGRGGPRVNRVWERNLVAEHEYYKCLYYSHRDCQSSHLSGLPSSFHSLLFPPCLPTPPLPIPLFPSFYIFQFHFYHFDLFTSSSPALPFCPDSLHLPIPLLPLWSKYIFHSHSSLLPDLPSSSNSTLAT